MQSNPIILIIIMFPKLLLFISILSSFIFTNFCMSQCLDHQKNLLLQLKNELIFNSSFSTKLVEWNHKNNCCHWHGVECDGAGHVISLQLDHESISGGIGDSSSLFKLKYLEKLNLAYNGFDLDTPIPKGIGNLMYLTHLNLSNAIFSGKVPLEISFLRRLVSLDISNDETYAFEFLKLEYPNLEMLLQNLTGLRDLYLDNMNINSSRERKEWSHIIPSYCPHLTTLSMRRCELSGRIARSFWQLDSLSVLRLDGNHILNTDLDSFAHFPNLTTLSLGWCGLNASFPNAIFHMPTLQHLDLTNNPQLSGSIPPFNQTGSLKSILLAGTKFSGSIPSSISNLKTLSYIDLSFCQFTGSIPSTFANLTELRYVKLYQNMFTGSLFSTPFGGLPNLVYLQVGENSLSGSIPASLLRLPSLETLDLSNNRFDGLFEDFSIVNVSNIVTLDLSNNRLKGPFPNSVSQLESLESLLLPQNLFNGTFRLEMVRSLANLTELDLSGNNLSVEIGTSNSSAYGLTKLKRLILPSCNMYGFPDLVKHSPDIVELDLSDNRIGGEIPSWIWGLGKLESLNLSLNLLTHIEKPHHHIPASLKSIDLHSNHLQGELHLPIQVPESKLEVLLLANNSFSGSIPTSLCNSENFQLLDLSVNKLNGSIPPCIVASFFEVISLSENNLSGHIPDNFPGYCRIEYLYLNNNNLVGKIPKSIETCYPLRFMNVGNNMINDTFPCMLSESLVLLALHSNRFHGEVGCNNSWPKLQIVDISSNNFSGSLESINFSSWEAMMVVDDVDEADYEYFLQSFGVKLTVKGLGMQLVEIWREFNVIDFSCNNFKGEIPNAIGDLDSLHLVNLSHNALNGSIPKSFGELGKLESLDLSQNQLRGHIPTELSRLTFLSVLNVSYNELVGEIPKGQQLQTFSADSFLGNPGLCGFNLNISCTSHTDDDESDEKEEVKKKREIEWEYVSAALGYAVGLGSFVWLLLFCRSFRYKYFGKIDKVVEEMLDARDKRRRTLVRRRRAERNREVRRH